MLNTLKLHIITFLLYNSYSNYIKVNQLATNIEPSTYICIGVNCHTLLTQQNKQHYIHRNSYLDTKRITSIMS